MSKLTGRRPPVRLQGHPIRPAARVRTRTYLKAFALAYVYLLGFMLLLAVAVGETTQSTIVPIVVGSGLLAMGFVVGVARPLAKLQGDAVVRPSTTVHLGLAREEATHHSLRALRSIPGLTVDTTDPRQDKIRATIRGPGRTGQKVLLTVRPSGTGSEVRLSVRPRKVLALFDLGENEDTLHLLVERLSVSDPADVLSPVPRVGKSAGTALITHPKWRFYLWLFTAAVVVRLVFVGFERWLDLPSLWSRAADLSLLLVLSGGLIVMTRELDIDRRVRTVTYLLIAGTALGALVR